MKKRIVIATVALIAVVAFAGQGFAMKGMNHGDKPMKPEGQSLAHAKMGGVFHHTAMADGYKAEFQVMSLKSMNMSDPDGKTHHVMVKFFKDHGATQVKKAAGKVKVISPSGKEQTATLKDYSGLYAANFAFDEKGKYGVICLFKTDDGKRTVKFWYPHEGM
jgi:hypothetical protein